MKDRVKEIKHWFYWRTLSSYSQRGQDRWIIKMLKGKRNGFFLEIGAGDGICISNTYLLEKRYGWKGILVEPTKAFGQLVKNRPNSTCDNSCVAGKKKIVTIVELEALRTNTVVDGSKYYKGNTLGSKVMENVDVHDDKNPVYGHDAFRRAYKKETIALQDLLKKYNAPRIIDYFSLDVEGYEWEMLKNFPFNKYIFLYLGIERPNKQLQQLLKNNGYQLRAQVGDHMYAKIKPY